MLSGYPRAPMGKTTRWKAVEEAGATPELLSTDDGEVQAFNHLDKADTFSVDRTVSQADAGEYDGLVLPGGVANPDLLRTDDGAVAFIRAFFEDGKPWASSATVRGRSWRPTSSAAAPSPRGRRCRPTSATPARSGSTRRSWIKSHPPSSRRASPTICSRSAPRSSRSSPRACTRASARASDALGLAADSLEGSRGGSWTSRRARCNP